MSRYKNFQALLSEFDIAIKCKIVEFDEDVSKPISDVNEYFIQDEDTADAYNAYDPFEPEAAMPEADDFDIFTFDKCLSSEVMIPKQDGY